MTQNIRRLQRELKEITECPPEFCTAGPQDDNFYHWEAQLIGPTDSKYQNQLFKLEIEIPTDYPFNAPILTFQGSSPQHKIVDEKNEVNINALCGGWTPTLTISRLLSAICSHLKIEETEQEQ